jgi:signal transduction histidine kinase
MWAEFENDKEEYMFRERQVELEKEYWAEMIDSGARVQKFRGTQASAWNILDEFVVMIAERERSRLLEIRGELLEISDRATGRGTTQGSLDEIEAFVERLGKLLRQLGEEASLDQSFARSTFRELIKLRQEGEKVLEELTPSFLGKTWRQLLNVVRGMFDQLAADPVTYIDMWTIGVTKWKRLVAQRRSATLTAMKIHLDVSQERT